MKKRTSLFDKLFFKRDLRQLLWSMFPHADILKDYSPYPLTSVVFDFYIPEYKILIDINREYDLGQPYADKLEQATNSGNRYMPAYGNINEIRLQLLSQLNVFYIKTPESTPPMLSPRFDGDAGWDIVSSEDTLCLPGQYVDVPSELFLEMPDHLYGLVQARSSTSKKKLLVLPGVIDPSYRGRVYAMVFNLSTDPLVIKKGDRIAQMLFMQRAIGLHFGYRDELRPSARGANGFGSSGQNINDIK